MRNEYQGSENETCVGCPDVLLSSSSLLLQALLRFDCCFGCVGRAKFSTKCFKRDGSLVIDGEATAILRNLIMEPAR